MPQQLQDIARTKGFFGILVSNLNGTIVKREIYLKSVSFCIFDPILLSLPTCVVGSMP